MTDLAT